MGRQNRGPTPPSPDLPPDTLHARPRYARHPPRAHRGAADPAEGTRPAPRARAHARSRARPAAWRVSHLRLWAVVLRVQAIGIVGDAGVRASAQQAKLYVGMVLILIFSEGTRWIFGSFPLFLDVPEFLSGPVTLPGGIEYPLYRLTLIAVGLDGAKVENPPPPPNAAQHALQWLPEIGFG